MFRKKKQQLEKIFCPNCKEFDVQKYSNFPNVLGYCNAKSLALYKLELDACSDYAGTIPKIEVVVQNE